MEYGLLDQIAFPTLASVSTGQGKFYVLLMTWSEGPPTQQMLVQHLPAS